MKLIAPKSCLSDVIHCMKIGTQFDFVSLIVDFELEIKHIFWVAFKQDIFLNKGSFLKAL